MVHTRPRFGGGKTMENFNLPKKNKQGVLAAKIMAHKSSTSCMLTDQTRVLERPNKMKIKGTNKQACPTENGPQNINFDLDLDEKKDECFQHFQSSIFESKLPKVSCETLSRDEHSTSGSTETLIPVKEYEAENDAVFLVQDGTLYQSPQQCKEVRHLMSIFKTLGIDITLKKYMRTLKINENTNDKLSPKKSDMHSGPIDRVHESLLGEEYSPLRINNAISIGNIFCKNLFLKDRKGQYFLIVAKESANIDLKLLKQQLKANRNLSFADAPSTAAILGLKSGEINPFVVMRESANDVRFIMHESLMEAHTSKTPLSFHPLNGRLQIDLTVDELVMFFHYFGKNLEFLYDISTVELDVVKQTIPELQSREKNVGDGDMKFKGNGEKIGHAKENEGGTGNTTQRENAGIKPKVLSESVVIDKMTEVKESHDDNMKRKKDIFETVNFTNKHHGNRVNVVPNWMIDGRKGKLKSFLKKNVKKPDCSSSKPASRHALVENCTEIRPESPSASDEMRAVHAVSNTTWDISKQNKTDENDIPDGQYSQVLPEITNFYTCLSEFCIQYHEEDLRYSTTVDIGPSLGCKCVLLKDKRQNLFFVITHEFYELDYGRLKNALKPRKKLDEVESGEVLDSLGVQPCRISPFSCVSDRAKSRDIRVFITEKIQSPEIILCIQHPYAEGIRLIMSSGELQRYLSKFIPQIGIVKEKAWHPRYNRIFTHFSSVNDSNGTKLLSPKSSFTLPVEESTAPHGVATVSHSIDDMNLIGGIESQQNTRAECFNFNDSPEIRSSIFNFTKAFLQKCLQHAFASPLMALDQKSSEDSHVQFKGFSINSSSVDPPSFLKANENNCHAPGKRIENNVNIETPSILEARRNNYSNNEGNLIPCNEKLTVEDVINHLKEMGVEFFSKILDRGDFRIENYSSGYKEASEFPTTEDNPKLTSKNSTDSEHVVLEGINYDEKLGDNYGNVELCSTTYLTDDGERHYIIVGGESDFITTRRFCRRFHLPGRLKMCEMKGSNLLTSPFSVALALKRSGCHDRPMAKICLVLFTSIFIDSDTVCTFHLDNEGSTIKMSSSQFQQYASEAGMEVWYMP